MNHPFYHLLWKSYRSQRDIWLAMLGGMLLLQLLAFISLGTPPRENTLVLGITILIALTFLCVSTLLMFVMEEEQGTATWLRLLPTKWWQQLGAGLVCSTGLTAAILVIGISVGLISNAIARGQIDTQFADNAVTVCLLSVLPIWLTGLVTSVIFRRIFVVLPVVTFVGVANWILTFDQLTNWPAILTSIAAVCVLPFLVRRWQLGRPLSITLKREQTSAEWQAVASETLERVSFRSRLLQRAAAADGLGRRTSLMLYWQELRQVIPFGLVMLCIGLASVTYHHAAAFSFSVAPLWLLAFTLECGLRTFRHDQQKQHGLFSAHRGVSPTKVWIIKNTVWFPTLLVVSLAAVWLDQSFSFFLGTERTQAQYGLHSMMAKIANPTSLATSFQRDTVELINGSRTTAIHALIAVLATGYFMAQLCSAWLRSPLVAGFIALMISFGLTPWINFSQHQDVPMIFSTWPIVVFCALATAWTSRSWMDRRQDGRIWTKRIVAVCLLLVGLGLGHQYYRRTQIPAGCLILAITDRDFRDASVDNFGMYNLPQMAQNPTTDTLWRELLRNGNQVSSRPCGQIISEILATPDWKRSLLPIEFRISWPAVTAPLIDLEITREAVDLIRKGNADQALDLLVKSVELAEYLSKQAIDWEQLERCMSFLRNLHQHIQWCASSSLLTAEDLEQAAAQFDTTENDSIAIASMLRNRQQTFFQLMQPNSELTKQVSKPQSSSFARLESWPKQFAELSFTDMGRHLNLMNATTSAATRSVFLNYEWMVQWKWQHQLGRWAETTPVFGFERDPMLQGSHSSVIASGPLAALNAAANIRKATWWILQMQSYRRESGQMPTEGELRGWLKKSGYESQTRQLIDWTTDEPFDLRLQGDGVNTLAQSRGIKYEFHAEQPVMGSARHMALLADDDTERRDNLVIPLNRNRVLYLEGPAWMYTAPPVSGELAELIQNSTAQSPSMKDATDADQTPNEK